MCEWKADLLEIFIQRYFKFDEFFSWQWFQTGNTISDIIDHKLHAAMIYKIYSTGSPVHVSCHIKPRESAWTLHSSDTLLLTVPYTRSELAKRAFDAQLHLSGTHYLHSSLTANFSDDLQVSAENLLFRLALDYSVHIWPQSLCLWSYGLMALCKWAYDYYYYYYYYYYCCCY